jgi:purine-binding chemotaxis protein CheW
MTRTRPERPPRDWEAIRAAIMRPVSTRTPEQMRAIMKARAHKLAARTEISAGEQLALAVFELAHERYAIELRWIREVVRITAYTPVPGTPAHIVGLTSIRGDIVVVVDLRTLFGLTTPGLGEHSRLVLIGDRSADLGILVDRALGTSSLAVSEVLAASPGVVGSAGPCIRGVSCTATIVLDGEAVLRDPRLVIDQMEGT